MNGENTPKRAANLTTFMLSQDYIAKHWVGWTDIEKAALGSAKDTGQVILNRLLAAGVDVIEAYVISHDKDEKELWSLYENKYRKDLVSNHIHFVAKMRKGETLKNLSQIIGVSPNFIEKPRPGKHAYNNMLSYLIHIKYPNKYQYAVSDVTTLCGKDYIDYYREYYRSWMHARAERIIQATNIGLNDLKVMIIEGKITKKEVFTDQQYNYILHQHYTVIENLFDNHTKIENLRNHFLSKES